jgi:hypothetical protein
VLVGPTEDLLFCEPWKCLDIPRPSVGSQEASQRRSANKASASKPQGSIDAFPSLAVRPWNRARIVRWPAPSAPEMSVGPREDLFGGQRGKAFGIAMPTMFGKE